MLVGGGPVAAASCSSCSPPARASASSRRRSRRRSRTSRGPTHRAIAAAVRAGRSRRRLAGRRGGDARGQSRRSPTAAETRRIFVNAVDDPANASAFLSGVVRRDGVTLAISTQRRRAGADRAAARGARRACCRAISAAWMRQARGERGRRGGATACRWTARKPLLLRGAERAVSEAAATASARPKAVDGARRLRRWTRAARAVAALDRRTRGCERTCLARRRRPGRSRAADAHGGRAAARGRPRALRRARRRARPRATRAARSGSSSASAPAATR